MSEMSLAVPASSDLLPEGWAESTFLPQLRQVVPFVDSDVLWTVDDELAASARAAEGREDVDEWRRAVAFVRRELGGLIVDMQGHRSDLSPASDKLSKADRDRRSKYRAVHEMNLDEFLRCCRRDPSWSNIVEQARKARARTEEQQAREIVLADVEADAEGDRWRMLAGDFRQRLLELPAGSVDMIVTDPPYPAEFLPLWSDLADHAARVLAPKGILVALSGQMWLPKVMARLGEHLSYVWVYNQPIPGAQSKILSRKLSQSWKPWLAYSNGPWPAGRLTMHDDTTPPSSKQKGRYRWEQPPEPAEYLIGALCPEGGTVLDPMAGTGSYGVAALETGRRFIGIEADAERFQICVERLEAWPL